MAFNDWDNIIFIDQKSLNTTPIQYMRTFRNFEIESNGSLINITDRMISNWKWLLNVFNISYGNDESILIENDTKEAIAYLRKLILFKEHESITYCPILGIGLSRLVSHL